MTRLRRLNLFVLALVLACAPTFASAHSLMPTSNKQTFRQQIQYHVVSTMTAPLWVANKLTPKHNSLGRNTIVIGMAVLAFGFSPITAPIGLLRGLGAAAWTRGRDAFARRQGS